jgi:NAD(P)-dependent dehydrogenase (short-subunit alcohol dehydrogenase family)
MVLNGRNAIIYGGGGSIGGAVARAFAREGATVHLAGRTPGPLETVAEEIRWGGGRAETAVVDALDEESVDRHADEVAARAGSIDVSLNVIAHGDVQGTALVDMTVTDLMTPVVNATRTLFLTARACARHMIRQRSGVILVFGGYGDPMPRLGGLQVAFEAQESLRRSLACELGPHGIRVVTLQTAGIPETLPDTLSGSGDIAASIEGLTLLGRAATLEDVGNVAAFAASDMARTITGSAINITCGTEIG